MNEVGKLEHILFEWRYETLGRKEINEIARKIIETGYLPVQPVELEVLTPKEIVAACQKDALKLGEANLWECIASGMKVISQATVAHNEVRGALYRLIEADIADLKSKYGGAA